MKWGGGPKINISVKGITRKIFVGRANHKGKKFDFFTPKRENFEFFISDKGNFSIFYL
jgi:hypothetical protein